MEGKLIKVENGYVLMVDNTMYATDNDKLSLKNCQEIENGYDLDELATKNAFKDLINGGYDGLINPHTKMLIDVSYMNGFQKALEILGNKKFSEDYLKSMCSISFNFYKRNDLSDSELEEEWKNWFKNTIQSLQQTEWDVEIEMICPHPEDAYVCGMQYGCGFDGDGCNHPNQIPYLDKDGCLILRRK